MFRRPQLLLTDFQNHKLTFYDELAPFGKDDYEKLEKIKPKKV
jgi:hypothetical protein